MKSTLAKALSTKQKADKLTADALAKAIGVSIISLNGILSGKSKPNKATIAKYAAFLGVSVADIGGKTASTKAPKVPKAPKAPKAPKKPGRKPGKKAAAKAPKAAKAVKPSESATAHPIFDRTLEEALNLFNDPLAVAIYGANDKARARIAKILGL